MVVKMVVNEQKKNVLNAVTPDRSTLRTFQTQILKESTGIAVPC